MKDLRKLTELIIFKFSIGSRLKPLATRRTNMRMLNATVRDRAAMDFLSSVP